MHFARLASTVSAVLRVSESGSGLVHEPPRHGCWTALRCHLHGLLARCILWRVLQKCRLYTCDTSAEQKEMEFSLAAAKSFAALRVESGSNFASPDEMPSPSGGSPSGNAAAGVTFANSAAPPAAATDGAASPASSAGTKPPELAPIADAAASAKSADSAGVPAKTVSQPQPQPQPLQPASSLAAGRSAAEASAAPRMC